LSKVTHEPFQEGTFLHKLVPSITPGNNFVHDIPTVPCDFSDCHFIEIDDIVVEAGPPKVTFVKVDALGNQLASEEDLLHVVLKFIDKCGPFITSKNRAGGICVRWLIEVRTRRCQRGF
jgi:hypothetical protein